MARDRVQDVGEVRSRRGRTSVAHSLWFRLEVLKNSTPTAPGEFLDYRDLLPIRTVTILETLTRECVADLINAGSPYTERAHELAKRERIQFDLATTMALLGKQMTIGDLIAHHIPTNSLGDIASVFSLLLDHDIFDLIANAQGGLFPKPSADEVKEARKALARAFEVRHILVHELPAKTPFGDREVRAFVEAAGLFARGVTAVVLDALEGPELTNVELIVKAQDDLSKEEKTLAKIIEEYEFAKDPDFANLESALEAFAKAYAFWAAHEFEGGREHTPVFCYEKLKIVREFAKDLRERGEWRQEIGHRDLSRR